MRGHNPREKWMLKLQLLERLVSKGYAKPRQSLARSTLHDWFPTREDALADEIVEDLIDNPEAPVEYADDAVQQIWLTDLDAARAFKRDLDENPDWFDERGDPF